MVAQLNIISSKIFDLNEKENMKTSKESTINITESKNLILKAWSELLLNDSTMVNFTDDLSYQLRFKDAFNYSNTLEIIFRYYSQNFPSQLEIQYLSIIFQKTISIVVQKKYMILDIVALFYKLQLSQKYPSQFESLINLFLSFKDFTGKSFFKLLIFL